MANDDRSEDLRRLILEEMDEIVYAVTVEDGKFHQARVEFVGGKTESIIGCRPEAFVADASLWFRLVHPEDVPAISRSVEKIVRGAPFTREYRMRHVETGAYHWMEDKVVPRADASGAVVGYMGVARDVTERKLTHAKLAETDRLVTVGTLAAGVAHEINNPLTYVLLNLERLTGSLSRFGTALDAVRAELARELGPERARQLLSGLSAGDSPDPVAPFVRLAHDASDGATRVRSIVRDLTKFSRVHDDEGPMSLVHAVESALNIATNEIKTRARLATDYRDRPTLFASEGRIAQVFLNLLVNAAHALPPGDPSANEIGVTVWSDELGAHVSVSDTGHGIEPERLARIFDPFYTTKPVGQGSGLGLWICRNIVTAYGGRIEVETRVGDGTTFTVHLPVRAPERPSASRVSRSEPVRRPGAGRGRVLVIDDEPHIREAIEGALGQIHDVVLAASGDEALETLEHDRDFDAIVCDLMMSRVSGVALYEILGRRSPELGARMVLMAGDAADELAREFLERVRPPVITKPFSTGELLGALDRVMGPGARRAAAGG